MRNIITLLFFLATSAISESFNESDWQVAFNKSVFKNGALEVATDSGRVDIVTSKYAIEVDHAAKYLEGIEQCRRYSIATNKEPGLALFIDGRGDSYDQVAAAKKLCDSAGIAFWLINEFVSVSDLAKQKQPAPTERPVTHSYKSPESPPKAQYIQKNYWINTPTGVRHNASCRWYGNTNNGRWGTRSEGRPCGICGG